MLRSGFLALLLVATPAAARAEAKAPSTRQPSTTGPAVDGVALALVPNKRSFVEGQAIEGQLLSLELHIKNVGTRRRVITLSDAPVNPEPAVERGGALTAAVARGPLSGRSRRGRTWINHSTISFNRHTTDASERRPTCSWRS